MNMLGDRFRIEIVDHERYKWYWIGKSPDTKNAFDDWVNNDLTIWDTILKGKYSVQDTTITRHSVKLVKLGIIKRIYKRDELNV